MLTDEFIDQRAEHESFVYATQADWHNAWHAENGPAGCPWDCALSDPPYEPSPVEAFEVNLYSPGYCNGTDYARSYYAPGEPVDCPCHEIAADAPF